MTTSRPPNGAGAGGGRRLAGALLHHAAALLAAAVFVAPLLWLVAGSLRQPGLPPPRGVEWLPDPPAWGNYARAFELVPLARYARNSILVVALAVPLTLVTASWAGFAMAQLPGRTRRGLLTLAILLRLVPVTALWLTRFVLFARLGLLDTVWALVAPALLGSSPSSCCSTTGHSAACPGRSSSRRGWTGRGRCTPGRGSPCRSPARRPRRWRC